MVVRVLIILAKRPLVLVVDTQELQAILLLALVVAAQLIIMQQQYLQAGAVVASLMV
jgi:hypothetical protein